MADKRISALDEKLTIVDDDLIPIVDSEAIPLETKHVKASTVLTKQNVGLGNVDNTSDADKPVSTATQTALDLKYDNTNPANYIDAASAPVQPSDIADFETTTELNNRDTNNRDRTNHTGTQLVNTISDFASGVLSTLLTGISFATSTAVVATDTILEAIGKLQAQLDGITSSSSKVIRTDYIEGSTSGPSTTASTSGTAPVIAEMTDTFTPADANDVIDVFFDGTFGEDVVGKDATVHIGIFIDSVLIGTTERSQTVKGVGDTDKIASISTQWSGTLSVASHTIDVRMWVPAAGGNNIVAIGVRRNLIVKETDE